MTYPSVPFNTYGNGRMGSGGSFSMSNTAILSLLKKHGVPDSEIKSFLSSKNPSPAIAQILSPAQVKQFAFSGGMGTSLNKPDYSGAANSVANGLKNSQGLPSSSTDSLSKALKGIGNAITGGGLSLGSTLSPFRNGAPASSAPINRTAFTQSAGSAANAASNAKLYPTTNGKFSAPATGTFKSTNPYGTGGALEGQFGQPQIQPGDPGAAVAIPPSDLVQSYAAPQITARDFSSQANDLASQAYGPMFDAINQGKSNAQGQYNTSDQVVKGLYDKLTADTRNSGIVQGQQYDQAGVEAAGRAKALQDRQAQVYGDTANTQTALLKSLGQEQSAAQVIGQGLNEQAFQQSQAATQGNAQQQYYQAGKQSANDYTTGTANAQNTQGTVAREGLVRDLASVLSQYDQQAASGKTQQATTALDLANQLSSRDLQVQTANASNQMGAAQMNQSAAQQAQTAAEQAAQFAYQQQQDTRAQSNLDRNYNLDVNKFQTDAATAAAQAQAKLGTSGTNSGFVPLGGQGFDTQSAPQQVVAQADAIDPGRGGQYLGLFNSIIAQGLNLDGTNLQQFATLAANQAQSSGLSAAAAYAAAASFWKKVMNRS